VLIAAARGAIAVMFRLATQLLVADKGERGAELFVLDNRARCQRLDLVEHPERQGDTFVLYSETTVRVIHHLDLLSCEPAREARRVQQKHHPVLTQCEIVGDLPLLAPRQDLVEIVGRRQRTVQIFRVRRRSVEAPFASSRPGPQGFDPKAAVPACALGE
jgi:hypothetical protein